MKNGQCPKCNSKQIFKHKGSTYRSLLSIRFLKNTALTDYVCCDCGYTESYVEDSDALEVIKQEYQKV